MHPRKLTAVLVSLLRVDVVREIAHLLAPGLRRVQMATAKDLHAVQMAELSRQGDLVRPAWRLQRAKATGVLRLRRALPSLPVVPAHRAFLFHAQQAPANRLTRAAALHRGPHDRLCRPLQAHPRGRAPRPADSFLDPAPDCLPRARRHASAAERSSGFRL